MRKNLWRAGDALMLLAFVFSVVVQLNDPDPWLWVAVYGLAGVAIVLSLAGRNHWALPAGLALTLGWALTIAPRVFGDVRFFEM